MFVSLYSVLLNIRTPGQKLRLGGDALGADPTYLLYLPSRSRGGLRRIDFAAWPRTATFRLKLSPDLIRCRLSDSGIAAGLQPEAGSGGRGALAAAQISAGDGGELYIAVLAGRAT